MKEFVIRNIDYIVAAFVFGALSLLCLDRGIVFSSDSTTFSEWADMLIYENFNIAAYLKNNDFVTPSILYLTPTLLMAVYKFSFGEYWREAFFLSNLILLGWAMWVSVKLLRQAGVRKYLIAALLPFLLLTDLQLWPSYILTDMLNAFLVVLNIYLLSTLDPRSNMRILCIFTTLAILFLSRPTGPINLLLLCTPFLTLYIFGYRALVRLLFPCILLTLILTSLIYGAFFELIFLSEQAQANDSAIFGAIIANEQWQFLSSFVKEGVVIHDRPDTAIDIELNTLQIAKLYVVRFLYFFMPFASTYSTIHNLANLLVISAFFSSVCIWIYFVLQNSFCGELSSSLCRTMYISSFIIFGLAFFHAATLIDWDWRYRFPTILPMFVLCATAFEQCFRAIGTGRTLNE